MKSQKQTTHVILLQNFICLSNFGFDFAATATRMNIQVIIQFFDILLLSDAPVQIRWRIKCTHTKPAKTEGVKDWLRKLDISLPRKVHLWWTNLTPRFDTHPNRRCTRVHLLNQCNSTSWGTLVVCCTKLYISGREWCMLNLESATLLSESIVEEVYEMTYNP